MRRLLASLFALLLFAAPAMSHNWSKVAERLQESVVMLETFSGLGYCSGWVIDNKRDYVMTAEHCINTGNPLYGGVIMVDGHFATVVSSNVELDAAVLYVEGINRPELKPRTDPIRVGMPVASYGFALEDGLKEHFRAGYVSATDAKVERLSGTWTLVDQAIIGGMSGGPIVDTSGKVVMMNQRSDRLRHALGKSIGEIFSVTSAYWRHKK